MRSLVVIPTYNERENLEKIVQATRQAAAATDILIVDDNSPDGTGEIADQLAQADRKIHVLHRPGKGGLGRAYQAGFGWALDHHQYDLICSMDADFSHDPRYLPELIRLASEDAAVAVGSRYVAGGKIVGWTWDRYLISSTANWLTKLLLGLKPRDVTAGFKCYRRAFLESFPLADIVAPGYAFQVEMLMRAQQGGFTITETPITFTDRTVGRSKVSRHELVTSLKSLLVLAASRRGLREAGKFGVVGILNFIIDIGLTNLLVLRFHVTPTMAGIAGVASALINSFLWNRQWTFRATSGKVGNQFIKFILINGSGAVIHAGIYTLLLATTHLWYNWAKVIAVLFGMIWNFVGTKYWAFNEKNPKSKIQTKS